MGIYFKTNHVHLAEIFDALFSGFYVPGFWNSARWTLNSYPHLFPSYAGLIGVDISESRVYCFGTFTRQREKDGSLESQMFNFSWDKDVLGEDAYYPGLCELNDIAVSFWAGVDIFRVTFKESLENKCIGMVETWRKSEIRERPNHTASMNRG